jgi:hypothetical protein
LLRAPAVHVTGTDTETEAGTARSKERSVAMP